MFAGAKKKTDHRNKIGAKNQQNPVLTEFTPPQTLKASLCEVYAPQRGRTDIT